jgi:tRNA dimethylallyltransferase
MSDKAKLANTVPKVLCIMGPTASGKTSLAIESAKALNGEVISVDSALVYLDMNIGTAKPSIEEQNGIAHHLIDIISPEVSYSVADFMRDAENAIKVVFDKGKLPILAGGTMMYFNALINGLNKLPAANELIREKINKMALNDVYMQLAEVDAISAQRINENDRQRLTRALEVFIASGKTLTYWQSQQKNKLPFEFCQFSIMPTERSILHSLIEQRFDLMLSNGFVGEVEHLLSKYQLHSDLPSMRSVGYRQVWQYLKGEYTHEQMRERGIIATRQLAKRQVTWLRSWQDINPLISGDKNNLQTLIQKVGAT